MSAEVLIVPAEPGHVEDLVRLNGVVQALHAERLPELFPARLDPEQSAAYFRRMIAHPEIAVLVATLDGFPCGYALLQEVRKPASLFKHRQRDVSIEAIAVDPRTRKRGVGRALIEAAVAEAERRGAETALLDHYSFNAEAAAFFETLGFRPMKVRMARRLTED